MLCKPFNFMIVCLTIVKLNGNPRWLFPLPSCNKSLGFLDMMCCLPTFSSIAVDIKAHGKSGCFAMGALQRHCQCPRHLRAAES